jgi:steroid 5-alpha reductase family enzyme
VSGVLLWTAVAILVVTTATWLISLALKDASIVDPVGGPGS